MAAQDLNVQVIANNIANINTTACKRGRAEFTDLLYQSERLPGVSSRGQNSTIPEGAQLGLGVRTAAIRQLHIQGRIAGGSRFDRHVDCYARSLEPTPALFADRLPAKNTTYTLKCDR